MPIFVAMTVYTGSCLDKTLFALTDQTPEPVVEIPEVIEEVVVEEVIEEPEMVEPVVEEPPKERRVNSM